MTVYGVHSGDDRITYVRQEGDADPKIVTPELATFSIGLVAPDPLTYSATQHVESAGLPVTTGGLSVPFTVPFSVNAVTVSGVVAVDNVGKAAVAPRVIFYGPVERPKITHLGTGESLQLNMDLASGEWLDLDLDRHTAMLNGVSSRRGYVSGQWFELAPGNNLLAFNSPTYSAGAEAQIVWRDAWK
nr:phage tail domain-containing protein [Kribbella sandramycini]